MVIENAEEALTQEELEDPGSPSQPRSKPQNAFTKLMAPKPKPNPAPSQKSTNANPFTHRMALGQFLQDPASHPASVVIYHTPDFVVIRDKFPKATVHTLLLPRSSRHCSLHPFDALADVEFLGKVRDETERLKKLVAQELRRVVGSESRADTRREAVLNGEEETEGGELPAGRDWEAEVISGVHAVPSMHHLHIHVLSRDMHSHAMKHRKHYNSFTTPFLVDLADFPLPADDPRRRTKDEGYLQKDLTCWRCGRNFRNQFQRLKEHLDEEFETWRKL